MANIKEECIGSIMYSRTMGRSFTIQKGNEKLYKALGFDIFEKPKTKRNNDAENKKGKSIEVDSDGDGTRDA